MSSFDTGLNTNFIEDEEEKKKQAHIKRSRDFDQKAIADEQAGYLQEMAEEEQQKQAPTSTLLLGEEEVETPRPTKIKDQTITSVDKTGIRAIEAQQDAVAQSEINTLKQLSEIDAQSNLEAQQLRDQHYEKVNTLKESQIKAQEQFNANMQAEMDYIDQQRERLANTKPESFWANKDTNDKLAMGIAVLVSSIGAGLTSSRADSGTDLLGGIIARDLEQKEKHLNRQIVALDKREMSMDKKAEIHSRLLGEFDAHIEQSLAVLQQKLEKAAASTKDAKKNAILQQQINQVKKDRLAAKADTEQNMATRISEKQQIMVDMETGKEVTGPMDVDTARNMVASKQSGKPLSELQGKSVAYVMKNNEYAKQSEQIEATFTEEEFKKIQDAVHYMDRLQVEGEIAGVGGFVKAIQNLAKETPEQLFEKAAPGKGGKYFKSILNQAFTQSRYDSGAKIEANDVKAEFVKMAPTITSTYDDLRNPRTGPAAYRRQNLKAHRVIGGRGGKLYFEKVKPRKKGKKKK